MPPRRRNQVQVRGPYAEASDEDEPVPKKYQHTCRHARCDFGSNDSSVVRQHEKAVHHTRQSDRMARCDRSGGMECNAGSVGHTAQAALAAYKECKWGECHKTFQ